MKSFILKVKKHIKKILIVLGLIGIAYGSTLLPSDIILTEVPIIQTQIGEKFIHKFQDKTTGVIFEVETTKTKYQALGLKDAKQPTYPNAKWLMSAGGIPIYATSTPTLLDNQYVVISGTATGTGTGQILIKLPNKEEKIIDSSELKTIK